MAMPVSYRIRTKIPKKSDIRTTEGGHRTNTEEALRREKGGNYRSRGVRRSYPYARKYRARANHHFSGGYDCLGLFLQPLWQRLHLLIRNDPPAIKSADVGKF